MPIDVVTNAVVLTGINGALAVPRGASDRLQDVSEGVGVRVANTPKSSLHGGITHTQFPGCLRSVLFSCKA